MSKNLDETVRLQSENREEWIREIKKGLLREQVALPSGQLISLFVGREKRVSRDPLYPDKTGRKRKQLLQEIKVKGKMEERTERESDSRRRQVADLLVLPRPAKSVQKSAGFSRKT